jgi:hypothetical protein
MAESSRSTDSGPPARPPWVKVSMIAAAVIVVVVVVVALAGGEHGPARHLPGGDHPAGHTPSVEHSP